MNALLAFFDILGTKALIADDQFSPLHAFDFANPLGIVARFNPSFRIAVFSDSAVMSCDPTDAAAFVNATSFVMSNWLADHVFVRGAMTVGEIQWIDHPLDHWFTLPNFQYARVYGRALTEAAQLERSGPGAVCFLSPQAAALLAGVDDCFVVDGERAMLAWSTRKEAERLLADFRSMANDANTSDGSRPHFAATHKYFEQVVRDERFLAAETSEGSRLPSGIARGERKGSS